MKRLTFQQMADVALQALANARRLYDDALLLLGADRLPSALMVTGLSADELGKHILVASFYVRDQTDAEWRKFWRRFKRHEEKLGDALLGAWSGDLVNLESPPDAASVHLERLAATYVDVSDDGTTRAPSDVVVRDRVIEVLRLLEPELAYCESVVSHMTAPQFAAVLESMLTSARTDEVRRLISEGGPESAMAFVLSTRDFRMSRL